MKDPALDFVLKLGRGFHAHGYPAHRLEEALALVSRRLGLEAQFFSMPTALFAAFGSDEQHTFLIRVEPGSLDLTKLTLLEEITGLVASGRLSPQAGSERVDAVTAAAPPYGPAATTVCFALASGSAARFFGGGLREVAAATGIGLVIGLLALLVTRQPRMARVFEPLAAMAAGLLATLAAASPLGGVSIYIATVSGLIVLVPGFTLTVALTELATRHLVSGTTRLASACGTFLAIGFGVALGRHLGEALVGRVPVVLPQPLPGWTEWAALLVAPLCFTVILRAQPRDAVWITLAGVLALQGARLGTHFLGPELGAFLGALVVGVAANAYARAFDRPAGVPLVPGLLLLVPGSLGFQSLSSLLERQTVVGVEAAFRMTLVGVSLATGLLFSNVVLPVIRRYGVDDGWSDRSVASPP